MGRRVTGRVKMYEDQVTNGTALDKCNGLVTSDVLLHQEDFSLGTVTIRTYVNLGQTPSVLVMIGFEIAPIYMDLPEPIRVVMGGPWN